MKKQLLTTAAIAAIAAPAFAGEVIPTPPVSSSAITADITLGYHSQYSYRGIVGNADVVSDVTTLGLGLTYDDGVGNQFFADLYYRELELTGGFRNGFGGASDLLEDHTTITVGVRRELIPGLTGTLAYAYNSGGPYQLGSTFGVGNEDGHEIQAKLDYAVTPDFVVYGLAAYEFNEFSEGVYLELGAAYNYAITDQVSLVASGALAASFDYLPDFTGFGVDDNGLSHYELRLSLPVAVAQGLTVTPYVSYVGALDVMEDYADLSGGLIEESAVIGGVEAVLTF